MSEKLFLKGQNEETLLPRVLRVFAKQGLAVKSLTMKTEADELTLEVDFTQVVSEGVLKVLSKQFAVNQVHYSL